jgi:ribonuclease P protein component
MNLSSPLNCSVLKNKDEISVVLKNGKKVRSDIGTIYFFNNDNEPFKKFAIFVKKNIGKAFYRNYIKRIIRFYIRSNFTLFNKYNRVIFFYSCSQKVKYSFLKDQIHSALKKVS